MKKLTLKDLSIQGKKVLVRVDFNVPLNAQGQITDDTRIRATLPTIQYILDHGGSVILMSHLGRPEGKKEPKFSLAPCAKHLSSLIHRPVLFAPDCIGKETETIAHSLKPGQILLLENLRFYPAEEKPKLDPSFAEKLAKLGDIYVSDAFGTAHRAHSSTASITQFFPQKAAAGLLLEKEIEFLGSCLSQPKHPFYAIIGGAKISSKMGVLKSLLSKVDALFIGGAMAYTFFKARGIEVGDSLCENEFTAQADEFLLLAKNKKIPVYLPEDVVIADSFSNDAKTQIIPTNQNIPNGWQGMDIGPSTIKNWEKALSHAAMIFWNGPLGVFEMPRFAKGTQAIAQTIAKTPKVISIIGGGDSVAAINEMHLADRFTHLSTGGGASLEFIEFGHLPGIDALSDKKN